jgi:hypothetical protein
MLEVCDDTSRIMGDPLEEANPSNLYYDGDNWWNKYATDEEYYNYFSNDWGERINDVRSGANSSDHSFDIANNTAVGDYYYYEKTNAMVKFAQSQGRTETKVH